MPQRTQKVGKNLFHTLFLAAALSLLSAVVRRERKQMLLTSRDRRKKMRVTPCQPAAKPNTPKTPKPIASTEPATTPEVSLSSHTASAVAQAAVRDRTHNTHSNGSTPGSRPASRPTGMTKTQAKELATFLKQAPVIQQQPRVLRAPVDREPEADEPNVAATVWLYRQLPDPTPPSRRLTPAFAHQLLRVS